MATILIQGETEALADLQRAAAAFDINELAEPYRQAAVDGILAAAAAQTDPDGNPWAELSRSYKEWKDAVAPGKPIGVLWGLMLDRAQLEGALAHSRDRVEHTYGIDPEAVAEAIKFQLGGLVTGTNQPQRPFWGLTPSAIAAMDAISDAAFTRANP